jgi:hypothetical protein
LPPLLLPPSELHTLDCALLKLSNCKLDKTRIGIVRMLLRARSHQSRWGQREEAERGSLAADAAVTTHASSSDAVAAVDAPLMSKLSCAYVNKQGDILHVYASLPAPLPPTHRDIAHLVGHAVSSSPSFSFSFSPVPISAHQLALLDLRRYLTKLSATREGAGLDVNCSMQLKATVEANAFELYAPRTSSSRKRKQVATPTTSTSADDAAVNEAAENEAAVAAPHSSQACATAPASANATSPDAAVAPSAVSASSPSSSTSPLQDR